tara:strand:+ start:63380 stop:64018 length:639 start_codon:yes stop_codon:yes gene_type:complete
MNKEKIIQHIKETHNPQAIILHGSRAIGKERGNSDWDLYLLYTDTPPHFSGREDVEGADVEWKAVKAPVKENEILDVFGVQLQFAKVLWEEESVGSTALNAARSLYEKGVTLSKEDKERMEQYLTHKANSLKDDIDTPYMFLRHQYAFFERAINWWFEMRGEYRKPFYVAMPRIKEEDPEYHDLLMKIAGDSPNKEKVWVAEEIAAKLFKNI